MSDRFVLTGSLPESDSVWPLTEGDNRIGRSEQNEIAIKDGSVSREHAIVKIFTDRAEVLDVGSRNGSWLNGRRIKRPETLEPGDQIQVGDVVLLFHRDSDAAREGTAVEAATRIPWADVKTSLHSFDLESGDFWKAVIEAAQLMVLPQPATDLLPAMLDLVESVVPADRILLLLRDQNTGSLDLAASRPEVDAMETLPLSRTLVNLVMENRESILVEDASNDPQFAQAHSVAALNLSSAMAAPLFDNETVIGLIYAHTRELSSQFRDSQLRAFTMLANLIAIKVTNARLLEEHREMQRLEEEISAAGRIQQRMLPSELPTIPGYDRLARLRPCLEMAGDFYDIRRLADGTVFIIVGDVSGKGSGAALLMSHILAAFRVLVGEGISVADLGRKLNDYLCESSEPTHYVTAWMARLDPATHRLTYMNAGHNPPFLRDETGSWTTLGRTVLPIGMFPDGEFGTREIVLERGSLLCIYTDGLVEARAGEQFLDEACLQDSLTKHGDKPLEDAIDGVFGDVQTFLGSGSFEDDSTLLLLRRRLD